MSNSTADQVIYLSVVLARHADLAEALEEYFRFDRGRANPVFNSEQREDVYFSLVFTKNDVLRTLQCGVRLLKEG